jgi:alkylhydroperoxidase family enzyme
MADFTIHTPDTAPEASKPLLEESKKAFGRVPGLHATMAEAPALLDGYKHLHRLFAEETSFDKDEITVVWQTINVEHECHYCVPAHTGIAKREKIDDAIIDALRDETPLADPRLEALRTFTLAVRDTHGRPSADQLAAFQAAGFDDRAILDVILLVAQKVMSNFTNSIFDTPTDAAFEQFLWQPQTPVVAQ